MISLNIVWSPWIKYDHDLVQSSMISFNQVWSCSIKFNQVQSCSIKLILVRSRYIKYNRIWSYSIEFDPVQKLLTLFDQDKIRLKLSFACSVKVNQEKIIFYRIVLDIQNSGINIMSQIFEFIIARQSYCANEFYEGPLCFCPFMINAHSTHHWFSVTDSVVWEPIDPFWSCESEPYVSLFTFKIGRAALQGEGHSCARTVLLRFCAFFCSQSCHALWFWGLS